MQQMLAKTFGAVVALLAVSTSLLGCGGGETPCESSFRQATEDITRMEGEMGPCRTDPDPDQSKGCQCNLLGGMVEVCQRFLGSCDDKALTPVWTQMREMYQDHMEQLGCGKEALVTLPPFFLAGTEMGGGLNPGLQASTAAALQTSNSSSVATRIETDARPLVDTVQASSLPSSNAENLTTVTSTQQVAGGSAGASTNFLSPTAYIVSGGGGGITSEGLPDHGSAGAGAAAPIAAAGVHFYPRTTMVTGGGGGITSEGLPDHGGAGAGAAEPVAAAGVHFYPRTTAVTGGGGSITSQGLPDHKGAGAGAAAAVAAAGVHFYPRTAAMQRGTQVQQRMMGWQQGVGGIAVMLLMFLVSLAVTVALLARHRQAPSEVEVADIGRP